MTLADQPRVDQDLLRQARIDLAAALRAAALYGYNEGIDNHFSYAVPGSDNLFLLNPYGPEWAELTASDLLVVDGDGTVVEGEGEWETTAFMIHRGAHRARASARCVFHTHMPFATAVSTTRGGFDTALSQAAMSFHGRVSTLAYGGLAHAADEGDRIGAAIDDDTWVVMLENHGVLVIGNDPAEAWWRLYFLERACQVQVLAQSTGRPLVAVPDEVVARTARQVERDTEAPQKLFASVRRRLDRESPGYDS
jgi:ribulose-5-phosphate 4-epimerase/fuculose-1-phosphate aldolase